MAQVFPLSPDPSDEGRAVLIRTLAALPDEWTLLCARRLGDAPQCSVDAVLIHPEIGIALVDLAPDEPGAAVEVLLQQLEREGFAHYFPGELPVVALSLPADTADEAGERLADAFEAAPRLSIADRDWADAVIELLLVPDDVAMAGPDKAATSLAAPVVGRHETLEEETEAEEGKGAFAAEAMVSPTPPPPWRERSRFAADDAPALPLRLVADEPAAPLHDRQSPFGRWVAAGAAVLVLGLGAGAWQLSEDRASSPAMEAAAPAKVEVPIPPSTAQSGATAEAPQPPTPPPSPPVRLGPKNLAKGPPAPPTPTRVDPLPPKPPVRLAAKNVAEAPPPPPKPTHIEPLPQPALPAAVAANAAGEQPAPSSAAARPAEPLAARQVAAAPPPPPPRPKPSRFAQEETPVRELMERQLDRPPVSAPEARTPVREARTHPPIDAGDLPPLEDATATPVARPPAPVTPPPGATAAAVGPPIRLLGPPGAPSPVSGGSVATTTAAAGGVVLNPRECRPYTADTTLSGGRAPVQGVACRGADGQWRLVSEVPLR